MKSFSEIEFGKARGELEATDLPVLLERGFYDIKGSLASVNKRDKYLILGFKGSGKSTIGEKLRLDSEAIQSRQKQLIVVKHLEDFPFKNFSKIFAGQAEPEAKYPTSWSWILMLVIIDHLRSDPGARDPINLSYNESIRKLESLGVLPVADIKKLVIQSSKSGFRANLFNVFEVTNETTTQSGDLNFMTIVESLKLLVQNYYTEGGLTLVIDGLDDILSKREVQYQSLAALIFEVDRLNLHFKKNKKPIQIVVLCRTELFERLPGPNKNKIRQDSAVELDWYHDPKEPEKSMLVRLANLRASLSVEEEVDVFAKWFPERIDGDKAAHFLLDLTRHTPRDFLALLNSIRPYYEGGILSRDQILSGARSYSTNYFLPEIRDELVGYIGEDTMDRLIAVFGEVREREISSTKLKDVASNYGFSEDDLLSILKSLFDCSAIGNKWRTPSGTNRYEFRFRNRNSAFDRTKTIVLHKGLWKALNLV
ncbi:hypothetical protein GCM10007860_11200 [Chitiniphilus shinanonensis]|uniref:KAP NTPase domain-containing protein n=1 Tax=Chitiniphilus shinanonensis TaxID=553088 RepID=A0ABQ6BQP1_9NEIS|nr:hypothetical protein [Chitiniphilus shinanonensis]GLS03974.1 hypothetical protein GCM10007860_11200 [Chitiniphilus shinanonensis]